MSDWATPLLDNGATGVLATCSAAGCILAEALTNAGSAMTTSTAWQASNMALFVPVHTPIYLTVYGVWWYNGATAAGNVDCGIYTSDLARIASAGSTAQGTISTIQTVSLGTPVVLTPGQYFLALASSSTTATFTGNNSSTPLYRASGCGTMASALPLPTTATISTTFPTKLFSFGAMVDSTTF